jgi:hypothetical protein
MEKWLPAIRYYLVFTARATAAIFIPAAILIAFVFRAGNWREILCFGGIGILALVQAVTSGRK